MNLMRKTRYWNDENIDWNGKSETEELEMLDKGETGKKWPYQTDNREINENRENGMTNGGEILFQESDL